LVKTPSAKFVEGVLVYNGEDYYKQTYT